MAAMTNYAENKFVDWVRGQLLPPLSMWYFALFSAPPTDAGGGTEFIAASYARFAFAASLVNLAGTQAAGSVLASSGNSGTTSNNIAFYMGIAMEAWGTPGWAGLFDAPVGGNLWFWGPSSVSPVPIVVGAPVIILPGQFQIQIDD